MEKINQYAHLSSHVYNKTKENRITVPSGFREDSWISDDSLTGFSAGVYVADSGNEVIIAFAGTNEKLFKDFAVANIPAGTGLGSAQITQASVLVLETIKNFRRPKFLDNRWQYTAKRNPETAKFTFNSSAAA